MPRHVHKVAKTKSSKAIVQDLQEARQAKLEAKKELMEHNAAIKLHSEQVMLPEQVMQTTPTDQQNSAETKNESHINLPVPVSQVVMLEPKAPETVLDQVEAFSIEQEEKPAIGKQTSTQVQNKPASTLKKPAAQPQAAAKKPVQQVKNQPAPAQQKPTFEKNNAAPVFAQLQTRQMNKPTQASKVTQAEKPVTFEKSQPSLQNDMMAISPVWAMNMTRMTEEMLKMQMQMISMVTDSWVKLFQGRWFPPSPMND